MTEAERQEIKRYMPASLSNNARVDVFIDIAEKYVYREYFGKSWTIAMNYFASHIGTLEDRAENDGAIGGVSSKREGDISISFSQVNGNSEYSLSLTSYGIQYKTLLNNCSKRPCLTGRSYCDIKGW